MPTTTPSNTIATSMDDRRRPLTSGVAIVTYNGLKYLPEQLASIMGQSRRVDHIVISDDRSTDGTWDYLQRWADGVKVPVTLIRNDVQLGLSGNVEQAIKAVDADIIFTADQDDIWFDDKVAVVAAIFEDDAQVQMVHTDAILVDSQGADLGTRLFGELAVSAHEREAIQNGSAYQVYFRRNVVTGATAAIRRSLLQQALPLPAGFYHDAWLAFFSLAVGKVHMLHAPTIYYRQHGANLVGVKKLGLVARMRRLWWKMSSAGSWSKNLGQIAAQHSVLHDRLQAHAATPAAFLAYAAQAMQFSSARKNLPRNPFKRSARVFSDAMAGKYGKFSYESRTDILRDIVGR